MGVAEIEGVVVLASRRVVGRGVEGVAPRLAMGRGTVPVVIAEARPEVQASDEVPVGPEELRVEVVGRAFWIDHVSRVHDEVGGCLEHTVAHRGLRSPAAPAVAHDEEAEGPAWVIGPEDRLGVERDTVGVRDVGVLRARKNDAIVSVFIEGGDGRESGGVGGDELPCSGLRSGVVDRSVRRSKRRRDTSCPLGEQHSVIVGVCRTNRKCPVQGDFRNSQRCWAQRHIAQIAQIERRLVGN